MAWCNDPRDKKYNSLVNINEKIKHEKLYRKDNKYDVLIVIDYNLKDLSHSKAVQYLYI